MKYADEEIVAYAKSHLRYIDRQKGKPLVLGFMGVGGMAAVIVLANSYVEAPGTLVDLLQDARFLSGAGFGFLSFFALSISVLGFVRMFSTFYGQEIAMYRLLVRLHEEKKTD